MFEILPQTEHDLVALRLSGTLDQDDYAGMLPEIKKRIETHGSLRLYWEMDDFHGWTVGGIWEDTTFDVQHAKDFSRVAMVGEKKWEEWMTKLMKPFTSAEVRYFDIEEREKALAWISESGSST